MKAWIAILGMGLVVLGLAAPVFGTTFYVPLPDVVGQYDSSTCKFFDVDLGVDLVSIQSMAIDWEGSVVAGQLNSQPYAIGFWAEIRQTIPYENHYASGPEVGAGTYPAPESFSAQTELSDLNNVGWILPSDGQFSGYVALPNISSVYQEDIIVQPQGSISRATLIIEATPAPEPATGLLLAVTGVGLLRRANKRRLL